MKTIQHTHTLFSYDGPQVFEAQDANGGRYIQGLVSLDWKGGNHSTPGDKTWLTKRASSSIWK